MENRHIIVMGSPDKLSLGSFARFFRMTEDKLYYIGEMHSLMSEESKDIFVEDFINKHPKGLITYYAKKQFKSTPEESLPMRLFKSADVLGWFDMYSLSMKVVKDHDGLFSGRVVPNWDRYVAKFG